MLELPVGVHSTRTAALPALVLCWRAGWRWVVLCHRSGAHAECEQSAQCEGNELVAHKLKFLRFRLIAVFQIAVGKNHRSQRLFFIWKKAIVHGSEPSNRAGKPLQDPVADFRPEPRLLVRSRRMCSGGRPVIEVDGESPRADQ